MDEKSKKIFNPEHTKNLRKHLRKNMTKAEIMLWSKLKGRQLLGYKFRRQHGIGEYIVDFYCPELKLIIEIDGGGHFTPIGIQNEKKRTELFNGLEIYVLRFTNLEVYQNMDDVIQKIIFTINRLNK